MEEPDSADDRHQIQIPQMVADSAYETDGVNTADDFETPRVDDDEDDRSRPVTVGSDETKDDDRSGDENDETVNDNEEHEAENDGGEVGETVPEQSEKTENDDEDSELQIINDDEKEDGDFDIPEPVHLDDQEKRKRMVLFFLTPSKQVVSLRNIQNGTRIHEVKGELETLTGLPSDVYQFHSSKYVYKDQTALILGRNVAMGAVIRLNLLKEWRSIYHAVERLDIDYICKDGGICLFGQGLHGFTEEELADEFQQRLFGALYYCAFKNERKICETLIDLGGDVNRRTRCGNTVLHVAACQNHMPLVDFFLKKGAELMITNRDGKTPIHIAQDIGSSTCERYMRLYNWSLTGKRHFPDMEGLNGKKMETKQEFEGGNSERPTYLYDRTNRLKSAPTRKSVNSATERSRKISKFHHDCGRTVDFVAIHNVPEEMQYNTPVEHVAEHSSGDCEPPQITETVPRKIVPFIDLAKSEENRTIIDFRKPRAKSAVVRAKHTPVYYNWYREREPQQNVVRPVRCKSSRSVSNLDELRIQKNEAAFRAWVRRKEREGAFDAHDSDDEEDENMKRKFYTDEENERAFKEWLDGKKELLEQMGQRGAKTEPNKTKREKIQAVVQIGETDPYKSKPDPYTYHTAYQRWMRTRPETQLIDRGDYKTVEDLKRMIDLKRKQTVLNAKAYEEWLEEKREEGLLKRRIRPKKGDGSPRAETFQKWIGMTATGDSVDSFRSSYRPTSSRNTMSRLSVKSMDSASILTLTIRPKTSVNRQGRKDVFEGFLHEDAWRRYQKTKPPPDEDKALRAVRFEPVPR